MVVRPGAKVGFLGNDTVLPNRNGGNAIKSRVVTDPTMIANYYLPRESDPNPRPDHNVAADFGAEEP
jgi:hypothetical protein